MAVDDPFVPSDPTQRPRPGAGRRGSHESTLSPRPVATRPYEADPLPPSARAFLGLGLNPLVQAASPLLLLIGGLRSSTSSTDVSGLRRHALEEIRRFEENAQRAGVRNEIVLAARYALCAGLDESVLSTPWGAQSEWAQHPLLVALHREAWGGEKFFEMLDRISEDPGRHIDLMELQYLCIAFGFAGKYQVRDRGHSRLAEVQQDLYRRIREQRGVPRPELSLKWKGVEDRRNPVIRYVPWWVVGAAALAVLTIAFLIYNGLLRSAASPVKAALSTLRSDAFNTAPAGEVAGPTLRSLLRTEEASRALNIKEDGARTVVTLPASDLFASASATVNPRYHELLLSVAAAVNQVPGRVQVRGHTDNQPIRSFRFSDNFELSKARAESVVEVLRGRVADPSRLVAIGVGDKEPIDPNNRALNRRVEIIHVYGS